MIKIGMCISGRYEIIEKVGAGGMADVYKARDNRLNRYVAIKVLKQEYSADTKFVTKFRAGTPLPAIFEPSRPDKEKQDRP